MARAQAANKATTNAVVAANSTSRTMLVVRRAFAGVSLTVADFMRPRYEGASAVSASRATE